MKIFDYLEQSKDELVNKVSWPTLPEVTNSAVVVLFASLLISLVVWAMDFCFEKLMDLVYKFM